MRLSGASCTLCPLLLVPGDSTDIGFGPGFRRVSFQHSRGTYGDFNFDTNASYHAVYVQDTWRFNRHITAVYGLRWEQESIQGTPLSATAAESEGLPAGFRSHYAFTGQFAPRVGVTVDPMGRGKTKIFYNFGRYFEYLPLDAAQRSLSLERDYNGARFAPVFRIGSADEGALAGQRIAVLSQFGTPVPQINNESLLCGATGGIRLSIFTGCFHSFSKKDPSQIVAPGTKLGYTDEHVIGLDQVPVGGRGKLGRTSSYYRLDLHVDYPWAITETTRLSFIADFFNVTNNRAIRLPDQFRQLDLGAPNVDFLAPQTVPNGFYLPFNLRLGARFEF